jgi:hypothetical protein
MRNPRLEVGWQLASGVCQDCHVARHRAAVEYEHAAAEVRLWESLLPGSIYVKGKTPQAITAAMHRVRAADARCVALGMWPAERVTKHPSSYYGDDREERE